MRLRNLNVGHEHRARGRFPKVRMLRVFDNSNDSDISFYIRAPSVAEIMSQRLLGISEEMTGEAFIDYSYLLRLGRVLFSKPASKGIWRVEKYSALTFGCSAFISSSDCS